MKTAPMARPVVSISRFRISVRDVVTDCKLVIVWLGRGDNGYLPCRMTASVRKSKGGTAGALVTCVLVIM